MSSRNWLGTGATPGDLNATDNWSAGTVVVSDDEALFPSNAPVGPSSDMATLTAVDLDLLQVMQGVTYSIGGSGNHLDIDADKVEYRGTSGKLWLKSGAGTTDWAVVNSTAADPVAHDCFSFTGATLTHLDLLRGYGTIESGATVTEFVVGQYNRNTSEAKLVIDAGATSLPLGEQYSGVVLASTAVGIVRIDGGTWTQLVGLPTTLRCTSGLYIGKASGTITTVYAYKDAVLDFTQASGVTTITTLYKHPSAIVRGWNPENNGIVVVTNLRVLTADY